MWGQYHAPTGRSVTDFTGSPTGEKARCFSAVHEAEDGAYPAGFAMFTAMRRAAPRSQGNSINQRRARGDSRLPSASLQPGSNPCFLRAPVAFGPARKRINARAAGEDARGAKRPAENTVTD
jgi:hypothetical protein